jgi:hypothetical protein
MRSTIDRQIESPSPVPPRVAPVVKNGSNSRRLVSADIPVPVSQTLMMIWSPRCSAPTVIVFGALVRVARAALFSRLTTSWTRRVD